MDPLLQLEHSQSDVAIDLSLHSAHARLDNQTTIQRSGNHYSTASQRNMRLATEHNDGLQRFQMHLPQHVNPSFRLQRADNLPQIDHSSPHNFSCNHCSFQAFSERCVMTHLLSAHAETLFPVIDDAGCRILAYRCPRCRFTHNYQAVMANHLILHYASLPSCNNCSICTGFMPVQQDCHAPPRQDINVNQSLNSEIRLQSMCEAAPAQNVEVRPDGTIQPSSPCSKPPMPVMRTYSKRKRQTSKPENTKQAKAGMAKPIHDITGMYEKKPQNALRSNASSDISNSPSKQQTKPMSKNTTLSAMNFMSQLLKDYQVNVSKLSQDKLEWIDLEEEEQTSITNNSSVAAEPVAADVGSKQAPVRTTSDETCISPKKCRPTKPRRLIELDEDIIVLSDSDASCDFDTVEPLDSEDKKAVCVGDQGSHSKVGTLTTRKTLNINLTRLDNAPTADLGPIPDSPSTRHEGGLERKKKVASLLKDRLSCLNMKAKGSKSSSDNSSEASPTDSVQPALDKGDLLHASKEEVGKGCGIDTSLHIRKLAELTATGIDHSISQGKIKVKETSMDQVLKTLNHPGLKNESKRLDNDGLESTVPNPVVGVESNQALKAEALEEPAKLGCSVLNCLFKMSSTISTAGEAEDSKSLKEVVTVSLATAADLPGSMSNDGHQTEGEGHCIESVKADEQQRDKASTSKDKLHDSTLSIPLTAGKSAGESYMPMTSHLNERSDTASTTSGDGIVVSASEPSCPVIGVMEGNTSCAGPQDELLTPAVTDAVSVQDTVGCHSDEVIRHANCKIKLTRIKDGSYKIVGKPVDELDASVDNATTDCEDDSSSIKPSSDSNAQCSPVSHCSSGDSGIDVLLDDNAMIVCPLCPKSLLLRLLPAHMQFHEKTAQFKCNHCSFSSAYRWVLDHHLPIHKENSQSHKDLVKLTMVQWKTMKQCGRVKLDTKEVINAQKLLSKPTTVKSLRDEERNSRQVARKSSLVRRRYTQPLTNQRLPSQTVNAELTLLNMTVDKSSAISTDDFLNTLLSERPTK